MPVPIHFFGAARGKSTVESTLALAQQETSEIFCTLGSADERQNALASLEVASTIIIEPSVLATILLLKLESILPSFPISNKTSQGALAEVNDILREDTLFGGDGGVLTKSGDRIAYIQVTAAQREERRAALSRWIESLKNAAQIAASLELATC